MDTTTWICEACGQPLQLNDRGWYIYKSRLVLVGGRAHSLTLHPACDTAAGKAAAQNALSGVATTGRHTQRGEGRRI